MTPTGHKLTPEQRERLSKAHIGQRAWNTGLGGCKRGHDSGLYVSTPSGVKVCLGCKRENGLKYRIANRENINFKNRVDRYGINFAHFVALYDAQDGCCAICKREITKEKCRIDHDHDTGKVRGLLCVSCNTGLGLFQDSPDVLSSAAGYLRNEDE